MCVFGGRPSRKHCLWIALPNHLFGLSVLPKPLSCEFVGPQIVAAATNRQGVAARRIACQAVELGNNLSLVIVEHQEVVGEGERASIDRVLAQQLSMT